MKKLTTIVAAALIASALSSTAFAKGDGWFKTREQIAKTEQYRAEKKAAAQATQASAQTTVQPAAKK